MGKKLFIVLGNGFTIDLLNYIPVQKENIDLLNLFSKGDTVEWPDERHEKGFLSYKYCPSLWTLGARPDADKVTSSSIIESIIACANMLTIGELDISYSNIYISAYFELVAYLRHLFIQYNNQVSDDDLSSPNLENWGWLKLIRSAYINKDYESIIIITYNYDIFLERLLKIYDLPFDIGGFETGGKIVLYKPHGSISFCSRETGDSIPYTIRKTPEMYEASLSNFTVKYHDLDKNYLVTALIPPSGDSSRLTFKWANELREKIFNEFSKEISRGSKCVISGLSYWHVDRSEIDSLLSKISTKNMDTYMVNPYPPKALSAVLTCLLPRHITYLSSERIGGIADA